MGMGIELGVTGRGAAIPLISPANLIIYYTLSDLNNSSGNGRTLTNDNGTTFGTPAKIGNAAQFNGVSRRLSSVDAAFNLTTFTLVAWFQNNLPFGFVGPIISRRGNGAAAGYRLYIDGAALLRLQVSDGVGEDSVAWGSPSPADTWQLGIAWRDAVAGVIGISVNDGTPTTGATAFLAGNTSPFCIGGDDPPTTAPFNGPIDEVGIWSRVLTAAERTALYNGGAGRTWPLP